MEAVRKLPIKHRLTLLKSNLNSPLPRSTRASKLSMSVGDSAIMSEDDYIAVGLACCFRMDPDSGKLNEAWVYEVSECGVPQRRESRVA